ncbi:ATP synthase gamma chain, chloroplastic [Capsicum baccatum]|uniref:ATP synthase gamma chain, chloroplastic n=1 Tax=Capsicum baccatum TaxID=33114 RepID=A0A2G2XQ92_CAPBA|nr:ATP synthase gamma chain, chloroplastic [Capsicum baccatum]
MRLYLNSQILGTLQESFASELATRMDAMSSATNNVVERQGKIIVEILEIEYENEGKEHPFLKVYEEAHRKKNKDGTRGDWVEPRDRIAYEEFQKKNIEEWRQTQPTSEDGTMVQPSPIEMNNMWTTVVGGPKKGRTYGTGVLQSSSTPSLFPSFSSTLQPMEEMEAMKKQIVELTQKCTANDARFAKFDKLEELVKKNMPQLFHDEEDNESDNN